MYLSVVLVLLFAVFVSDINAYSYCDPTNTDICKNPYGKGQDAHIACDPAFRAAAKSTLKFMYPMTRKLKKYILDWHNKLRDKISSGTEITEMNNSKYPPAGSMRELIWDNELAYISHVHAKICRFEHDQCRSTRIFPYAGQNLGYMAGSNRKTAIEVIDTSMDGFYSEKNKISDGVEMAKKYDSQYKAESGHFTLLMNYQISRVGCAISSCGDCASLKSSGKSYDFCYILTCDYDFTNIKNTPVYREGAPASDCKHWNVGKSDNFPNLCANKGENFALQM